MKPQPPPSSPTEAIESDGEDEAKLRTSRREADQRSTLVFDALVLWSWKEENECYQGITPNDFKDAQESASVAYINFRDRMPEYQDDESDDGAVCAYNAFRGRVSILQNRRARESKGDGEVNTNSAVREKERQSPNSAQMINDGA